MSHKRLLTSRERILLHLPLDMGELDDRSPYTQKGIAFATGVTLNHVPRELAALMRDGLVVERREHVPERGRRLKVYSLTEEGKGMAGRVEKKLSAETCVVDGEEKPLLDMVREFGLGVVDALEKGLPLCSGGRVLAQESIVFHGIPETSLVGRQEELRLLAGFLSSKDAIMVVYGGKGSGKKALLASALRKMPLKRAAWLDASTGKKEDMEEQLSAFHRSQGLPWSGSPDMIPHSTVLAVADYNNPEEALTDMLALLAQGIQERRDVKMIITAREDIPVYDRFYSQNQHRELTLKGLSFEESSTFLGITGEEMKTIHQLLKGKPLAMKYLLEGDRNGLLSVTPLNPEEVRLLFYLKEKGLEHRTEDE